MLRNAYLIGAVVGLALTVAGMIQFCMDAIKEEHERSVG